MKPIKGAKGRVAFHIESSEKHLLLEVLKLYPMVPPGHHQLSKTSSDEENQQLLDEALMEQRSENKKELEKLMNAKSRFRKLKGKDMYSFSVKTSDAEWLLQVLNDIRLGAWIRLGSPEQTSDFYAALDENTAPYFWAMEISGHFQMTLLQGLADVKS